MRHHGKPIGQKITKDQIRVVGVSIVEYRQFPTLERWKADSSGTHPRFSTWLEQRTAHYARSSILLQIDELVETFHRVRARTSYPTGSLIYLAFDIYFTLDDCLKEYRLGNSMMDQRQEPAIMALYKFVVGWLCTELGCHANDLVNRLEWFFGRKMSFHGTKLDTVFAYTWHMSRPEAAKFKLHFQDGKIYQTPWWRIRPGVTGRVPANSCHACNPYLRNIDPNWGCFTMAMNQDIYMGPNFAVDEALGKNSNVYHSSYVGADTAMCAGSLLIENGVPKGLRPNSGHYKVDDTHMVNVLRFFEKKGISIAGIRVLDHSGEFKGMAPTFLRANENWDVLRHRAETNVAHLAVGLRESKEYEAQIEKHWDVGLARGMFPNDEVGRRHFIDVYLPNLPIDYTDSHGAPAFKKAFAGINPLYVLEVLKRAEKRNSSQQTKANKNHSKDLHRKLFGFRV